MSYHVRRSEREIADPAELEGIIGRCKICTLALAKDNEPYVVTLSYGWDRDRRALYFHCGKEGRKMDWLRANPRTSATIIEDLGYDQASCDHAYKSVVLDGRLIEVADTAEVRRAMELLIRQLHPADPELKLARLVAGDRGFDALRILRLDIGALTGKGRSAPAKRKEN
jgi:nitroimidazol reductase NimA-like FMN-containing flavoprotein (pyridoxamine 5'-phosphate oxidase superfamily)